MKFTITVESGDAGDAFAFIKSWAEDVQSLAYLSGFPVKAEWEQQTKSGATRLRAWLEPDGVTR